MDSLQFAKEMNPFFDSLMEKYHVPGFDCAIYYKHQPFYRYRGGYASLENSVPMDEQHLFHGYSITKLLTCTAGLQLIEKGLLRLEDLVEKYLPEFQNMQVMQADGSVKPAQNKMTIKDLFCMTAGFNYAMKIPAIDRFKAETDGACPTDLLPKYLSKVVLDFEPSTSWKYSLCHDVLAVVIQRVSGMLFSEYLQKNIFDPLGMQDTGLYLTPEKEKRMADKYWYHKDTGVRENVGVGNSYQFGSAYESGGAGIITSVNDYIKFADALCKGDVLLKRETTELMYQDHLPKPIQEVYVKTQHPGFSYGLGVRTIIDQALAESTVGFGDFGWGGAAGAFVTMHMEKEISLVYLQHMLGTDTELRSDIRNKLYELLP